MGLTGHSPSTTSLPPPPPPGDANNNTFNAMIVASCQCYPWIEELLVVFFSGCNACGLQSNFSILFVRNHGRRLGLRTSTCLEPVVGGRQGHALLR